MNWSKLALSLPLVAASMLITVASFADEKAECIGAASKGQTLRDAHDLIGAREQFRACATRVCPAIVQTDCGAWLDEVERATPSVVLSAKEGEGRDLLDVVVTVDGSPLARKLDGQAVPMNPGLHTFHFELANGTDATSQVLVREGEKAQRVAVVLEGPPPVLKPEAPRVEAPPTASPVATARGATARGATQRVLGIVLGGVGIVALGVGGGIVLDAKSKDNTAASERGTAQRTDSLAAVGQGNVGSGVFVAGAVVAVAGGLLWVTVPSAKVSVGTDGSEVLVRGTF